MSYATEPSGILIEINKLLEAESDLYMSLYTPGANTVAIIDQINDIAAEVSSRFQAIRDYFENSVSRNLYLTAELADKIQQAEIMEQDLLDRRRLYNMNLSNRAGKIRAVEINTYYSSRYSAQTEIMKIVIIACVPLVVITLLTRSNFLPPNIADILMSIVIIIGAGVVTVKIYDLSIRNNMNFDEYEWDKSNLSLSSTTADDTTATTGDSNTNTGGCVDGSCCSVGTYFDINSNQCLIDEVEPFANINEDVKENRSIVVPYNSTQTNYGYVNN